MTLISTVRQKEKNTRIHWNDMDEGGCQLPGDEVCWTDRLMVVDVGGSISS